MVYVVFVRAANLASLDRFFSFWPSLCRLLLPPPPIPLRFENLWQVEATQIMRIRDNIVRMYAMMTGQTQEQITIVSYAQDVCDNVSATINIVVLLSQAPVGGNRFPGQMLSEGSQC